MKKSINVDYGIDSRYKSRKEKENDSLLLMQSRLEKMKELSQEEILKAKLLQLKLRMEEYIKESDASKEIQFSFFLTAYIDSIYSKRIDFARDLNITPNYLSKVINNHREPNEEFIYKLMIHSEKIYKHITKFEINMWYKLYYQEKLNGIIKNQKKWKNKYAHQIKLSEIIG